MKHIRVLVSEVILVDTFSMFNLDKFRFFFFLFGLVSFSAFSDWFEDFKSSASDGDLHQLLYEMPKGGDLHLHLSGSGFSEWWYELALLAKEKGYNYYTKVKLNNCVAQGWNSFGPRPYQLMFQTIVAAEWKNLSGCEREEFFPISDLSASQQKAFLDSIRLDKSYEGRDEFFGAHWQRLADLLENPFLISELIAKNFSAFADEGLLYLEPQVNAFGYRWPDQTPISPDEVAMIFRERLTKKDIKDTGLVYRFQHSILRFLPDAEKTLEEVYRFVSRNDPYVGVNMVGREDNDKGYPLRFLPTLRNLRREYSDVRLSIHAGEVDEPNFHVRDTLLLGADRIGHGLNLITDPETMRLMRYGPYLVEINLISNLLLEYVDSYEGHPFGEYLRIGIPVALSTDDRGMWDSTMTDEFFVAVKEFNLSWKEIKELSRNSLRYAFVDEKTKARMLALYETRISSFEEKNRVRGSRNLSTGKRAPRRQFICKRYGLCD